MTSRTVLNRAIILVFMALVGFSFAKSIQYSSIVGFILASASLFAAIYFLYLLAKAKEELEAEESKL
jgi:ribonucleotide reductase alpha subunit